MNIKKQVLFPLLAIGLSVFLALFCVELILQVSRVLSSYAPTLEYLDYKDTWLPEEEMGAGGFLQPDFDQPVMGGYGQPVEWITNSDGFRNETDFDPDPPADTVRILSLGDSFTAGYRVGQQDTFSYHLQEKMNQRMDQKNVQVMVSCIEDPGYALYYLQQYGHRYRPDVVLLGITLANDITETYLRLDERGTFDLIPCGAYHCLEKRDNHTTVALWEELSSRTLPELAIRGPILNTSIQANESILDSLLLVRRLKQFFYGDSVVNQPSAIVSGIELENAPLFDLSSGLGFYLKEYPPMIQECWERLFQVLQDTNAFCQEEGMRLVIGIHPQRFQVQPPDWNATVDQYQLAEGQFDLEKPNRIFSTFCREQDIPLIDPTDDLREIYTNQNQSLYFPLGDMHWNPKGHEAYAEVVVEGEGLLLH